MSYPRMGRDVRAVITVLLVGSLAFSTVWFAAQASQHHADYVRAAEALASVSARASSAQVSLVRSERVLVEQGRTIRACRTAITRALGAMDLAAKASVLQVRGGTSSPARTIAASGLLSEAIGRFRVAQHAIAACREGSG